MSALERLYAPPEIGAPGKRVARRRRRDLLWAGLFVLGALLIAAATVALVAPALFGQTYRLRSYFSDARGLERGILVTQDGYTIGAVESVTPVFPGQDADAAECPPPPPDRAAGLPCFRATLRLPGHWPIPADSTAQLGAAGLLSGDAIQIRPGRADDLLGPDAVLANVGREPDLMARLNGLSDTLQRVVDETIAPALAELHAQIAAVGELLGTTPAVAGGGGAGGPAPEPSAGGADAGVAGDAASDATGDAGLLASSRERLAGAFESLNRIAADLEQVVDPEQLGAILTSVERLTNNLADLSATLDARTTEVGGTVQRFGDLAADLQRVVTTNEPGVQASVDNAQYLMQELAAGLAPILANIESASRELSALARELRSNPSTVIRGREQQEQAPWFND